MRKTSSVPMAICLASGLALSCAPVRPEAASAPRNSDATVEVVPISRVQWEALNPARGDQSPRAGTLWGDRSGAVPTGFLAKFVDGFSSPPHIHNVSYRAVVLEGLIHNDDPAAAAMWMPPVSFWTQPKGEVHVTSAKGAVNMALVEIDEGPYLVRPPGDAFDSGERPVNVDATNVVWVDASSGPEGPKLAYLWGTPGADRPNGAFIKLPPGLAADIHSLSPTFRAVVVQGRLHSLDTRAEPLDVGSYFGSKGEHTHRVAAGDDQAAIMYVHASGRFEILVP